MAEGNLVIRRGVEVDTVNVLKGPGNIDRVLIPTHVTDEFRDFSLPLFRIHFLPF